MAVVNLRQLSTVERDRILYMQRATRRAWHDRKNPDDGIIRLTEDMIAKRPSARTVAMWTGPVLFAIYVAASAVWFTIHVAFPFLWGLLP